MTERGSLFDALRRDVADFPDGEISVESKEIAALLVTLDAFQDALVYERGLSVRIMDGLRVAAREAAGNNDVRYERLLDVFGHNTGRNHAEPCEACRGTGQWFQHGGVSQCLSCNGEGIVDA